jgi:phosphatidate cytidylyltransferase
MEAFEPPPGYRRPPDSRPEPRLRRAEHRPRRSETTSRVLVAIPWIAFAVLIIAVGDLIFALAMIGLGVIGLREFFDMTQRARPIAPAAFVGVAALILAAHFGSTFQVLMVAGVSFLAMFIFAVAREGRRNVTFSMAVTVFGVTWIGIPLVHAVLLRDLPLHGGGLLVDVLVGTFVADTAAYGGGRLFGSRPIAPILSPNKTLEGLMAGFFGGMLAFWFAGLYQDWLSGTDALVMGACVAALAPLGDLFESLIKRDFRVKDSGNVFGPHGGLLDRLDAVFFTVVAGYYLSVGLVY